MKLIFTSFLCMLLTFGWSQNCDLTIDLNPVVELCAPGSTVLIPVIDGDYESFFWSPTAGLSDPDELITTANVTDSTVYTLSVLSLDDENLIINGDFSLGDTGFTSDYVYGTGGGVGLLSSPGQYAIADNAGDTHNQFANCSDHTGGGNMMVVNASGDASNIWCQTITVSPNTDYFFSTWVTSVVSENPAQLQFSVNGTPLSTPFNASPNTCNWQQFSAQWSADTETSVEICIANTNFTPAGNDFALDDISFRAYCTTTAEVAINVTELDANVAIPTQICAAATELNPDAYFTPSTDTGGSWQLDGVEITTFNPATLANGVHTLTYTVSTDNCSSSGGGQFTLADPPAAGSPDYFVTCIDPGTTFTADLGTILTNEDPGGTWEYFSGPAGATIDPQSGQFSTAAEGTYVYIYIADGGAVCPNDTTYQEFDVNHNPIADLPATATLDCTVQEITLSGPNTSVGNDIAYEWFRDGVELLAEFNISLEVDAGGVYRLEVRDEDTNCRGVATTVVEDLSDEPIFSLAVVPAPCLEPDQGSILITEVITDNPPYLASIDGENYLATDQFTNLSPGDYSIQVQDAGGCESEVTINLPAPLTPTLSIQGGNGSIVNLGQSTTLSVVSNPPLAALDTLIWSPALPDSLRTGDQQWRVQPEETTNYTLFIRDQNGCEAEASFLVTVRPGGTVFIPNAISPNNDGTNDRFVIYDAGAIAKINSLQIFDRWGALVYQAKDLAANSSDRAWDGRYADGRRLPAGVYIYSTEVTYINGSTEQLQGEISLVY